MGSTIPGIRDAFDPKYLTPIGAPKPLCGLGRVQVLRLGSGYGSSEVFLVEGPIDYLLLWQWGYPAVATLGNRIKREHIEALQGVPLVYLVLVPHRDDAGRQM